MTTQVSIPECSNLVQKRDAQGNLRFLTRTKPIKNSDGVTVLLTERVPDVYLMVRKEAWHKLGTIFQEEPSIDQIHQFMDSHLEVDTEPAVAERSRHRVPDCFAVTWNNRAIGFVGPDTILYPNAKFISAIKEWQEHGCTVSSVGYLEGGAKVFASMAVEADLNIRGSKVELYLNHHHGHCNQLAHWTGLSEFNQVCGNTVGAANAEMRKLESTFMVRHVAGQDKKLSNIREFLGLYVAAARTNVEMHNKLEKMQVTKADLFAYFKEVFPSNKKVEKPEELQRRAKGNWESFLEAYESSPGCKGQSWLDALSGMTNLLTHTVVDRKNESFADRVGRTLEKWMSPSHQAEADRRTQLACQMAGVV